jgi:long-chain acyl-CoA synthetase
LIKVNRYEWVIADLGALTHGIPIVALYGFLYNLDTLGPDTSEFILNHAEIPILVCSADKVAGILSIAPKCPKLKTIVVLGADNHALSIFSQWGLQIGVSILSFDNVIDLGKKHPRAPQPSKPDDVFCLSYTSGFPI